MLHYQKVMCQVLYFESRKAKTGKLIKKKTILKHGKYSS